MLTLTANTRLARMLRREYDLDRIARGVLAWEPPDILPLAAWLETCWRDGLYSAKGNNTVQLLRHTQELAVWEDIVGGSAEGAGLLQVAATAEAALNGWHLLHSWRLRLDAPEWDDTADTQAFKKWATEFQRRCDERRWLSSALLPEFVAEKIQTAEFSAPPQLVLAGFAEFTPAQERLLDVLRGRGCSVDVRPGRAAGAQDDTRRVAFTDTDDEIRKAARWAHAVLDAATASGGRQARIGIVVPAMSGLRRRIERIFAEEFHPSGRLAPARDSQRVFNLSLGPALSEYPLLQSALLFLRSNPAAISLEDASRFVRSPFLPGAEVEQTRRGLLDARLRQLREPEVSTTDIRTLARSESRSYASPILTECLRLWERSHQETPARQLPSDWAVTFSSRLRAIGWPGDRPLNSAEHQTAAAWSDLLSEFASLDSAVGPTSLESALLTVQRLAAASPFQPESEPAPIQVLGILEASGIEFDSLWILGMHDGAWPPVANANPFLPLRLQRLHNLPHSSPQRELEFTRLLTHRLLASASTVIVSHPRLEGDSELRSSPLFADIVETSSEDLGLAARLGHIAVLHRSSMMETLPDLEAPPWDGALHRGGTAIFLDQAACPFRAFAHLRLGAEPLESAWPGLSPMDRGVLIHDIFQRLWNEWGSHETLMAADPQSVNFVVREEVGAALAELSRRKKVLRRPRFRAIEQARLEKLAMEWLELEKQRQPFIVLEQEQTREVLVGGIPLTIRADRIDRLEDGTHIVIDYKTSVHRSSEWEGARPDEPQLPLYAVTADVPLSGAVFGIAKLGECGFKGITSADGILPKAKARSKDAPLPEQIQNWRSVLDNLADEFRRGKAIVDPKNPATTCRYCGLHSICRVQDANAVDDESERETVHD